MRTPFLTRKPTLALLCGLLALTLAACSDQAEKPAKQASAAASASHSKPTHNPNPFDHSGDLKITDSERQKFEQVFAAQCVARETRHSTNKEEDSKRAEQPCTCIATFLMKDLTGLEAEKFLQEHENPQSLKIKYENAAYHCLQQKAPPKAPDFARPAPAATPAP